MKVYNNYKLNFKFNFNKRIVTILSWAACSLFMQNCNYNGSDTSYMIAGDESREMQKGKIKELLTLAEQEKPHNIQQAIDTLEKAKALLPSLIEEITSLRSLNKNNTIDKESKELLYLSRCANIAYEIQDYEYALPYYEKLMEKLPSDNRVYKAQGDCLRKLAKSQEAIVAYSTGIRVWDNDDSAMPADKAAILNSRGVAYLYINKYDEAEKDLTEAIRICKGKPLYQDNPLYHCNKGSILYAKGDKAAGLQSFRKAYEIVERGELPKGLTKENINFVKNKLAGFNLLEEFNHMQLKNDILARRVSIDFANFAIDIDDERENIGSLLNHIKDTKGILDWMQQEGNQKLYEYYDGFLFSLSQSYDTSKLVLSNMFVLELDSTGVKVVSKLVSLIPLIGDKASSGIEVVAKFIKKSKITKSANNVCKFATTSYDFESVMQDIVCEFIRKEHKNINFLKPDIILPKWSKRFEGILNKAKNQVDKAKKSLYGERNETDMQKLGHKTATDLIALYIASGKLYGDRPAIHMNKNKKKSDLVKFCSEIIHQYLEKYEIFAEKVDKDSSDSEEDVKSEEDIKNYNLQKIIYTENQKDIKYETGSHIISENNLEEQLLPENSMTKSITSNHGNPIDPKRNECPCCALI
jgi:tetratricopeptide (TPR) repeat protein